MADDAPALQAMAEAQLASEAPAAHRAWHVPRPDLLGAWARGTGVDLAPVAAVVGGVVANHVIRAVSGVGAPINNCFLYTLFADVANGGAGSEERMPYAAPEA